MMRMMSVQVIGKALKENGNFMKNKEIYKITLSSIFLAMAYVLPFLTGQVPQIGSMLCPMHLPVILCGLMCGWKYGLIVGLVSPLLRSLTLGMPPLFPTALAMAVELAVYGFVSGFLYQTLGKRTHNIYIALIISMLLGRICWGIAMFSFLGFNINKFGLSAFWLGAFVNALPGIIIQIVLIPLIVIVYNRFIKE